MFFVIVLAVLSLMYGYVGWRLISPAAFSTPISLALWALLVLFLALPFVQIFLRMRGSEGPFVDLMAWIGYFSFGMITLLFALVVIKDIFYLGWWGIDALVARLSGSSDPAYLADPERRRAITNISSVGILGLTGGLSVYGLYKARREPDIVRIDVPIANLPEALAGLTIAQLTDIHVSSTIKRGFVERIVRLTNDLKPDIVAVTGDLVDGSVAALGNDVAPLADLVAPHGRYFITGNHEYYSGVGQWLEETRRLGMDVLLNEHRVIERNGARLLLAGVTDFTGGQFSDQHRSDPLKARANAPDCDVSVLLAHQPLSIYDAATARYDYVLSGHTHGGQYFPYHWLVALFQPYVSGLYRHNDKTQIYVSTGTGYWGPQLRLGTRSEITLHRLVPA